MIFPLTNILGCRCKVYQFLKQLEILYNTHVLGDFNAKYFSGIIQQYVENVNRFLKFLNVQKFRYVKNINNWYVGPDHL